MNNTVIPSFEMESAVSSTSLYRLLSVVSDVAVAVFEFPDQPLILKTSADRPADKIASACFDTKFPELGEDDTGAAVIDTGMLNLSAADLQRLDQSVKAMTGVDDSTWRAIDFTLSNGSKDRLALQINPNEDFDLTRAYLQRVWPVLRQDCFAECRQRTQQQLAPISGEWDMLNRIDVAMIILDRRCRMYRVNLSARELLDSGKILARGKGGIFAANRMENEAFKDAVAKSAESDKREDHVVLLSSKDQDYQVPVTLTRYIYDGTATNYVVAMLPTPPSSERVEALVRQMGLTSSEARVAALMQLGLSNREAAKISGLKVETFNTYAKRVLSKLNVSGRTEMAQLLTWQASGGRMI